jgi:hypothetical protein
MHVPLTLIDFLYRAERVYGERTAVAPRGMSDG